MGLLHIQRGGGGTRCASSFSISYVKRMYGLYLHGISACNTETSVGGTKRGASTDEYGVSVYKNFDSRSRANGIISEVKSEEWKRDIAAMRFAIGRNFAVKERIY